MRANVQRGLGERAPYHFAPVGNGISGEPPLDEPVVELDDSAALQNTNPSISASSAYAPIADQ